jgi:HAD superfamily hydrolase (TIGR01450 family)
MNKIKETKLFLFDMDGTLYLGDRLYDFTKELLATIKENGGKYMFMTNNSSKSVADYIKKLDKLGIKSNYDDFITSSQATAYYLKKYHNGATLYVCGTESLKEELRANGFKTTENLDETDLIVMGFDTELTFKKLHDVSKLLLTRPNIPYIATNPDYVCPTEFGSVPDCGSVCDMLYNVSGRRPIFIGKPQPTMIFEVMKKFNCSPSQTLVIGDRLYTDIASGVNANVDTVCVLSGEAKVEDVISSEIKPTFTLNSIVDILNQLND